MAEKTDRDIREELTKELEVRGVRAAFVLAAKLCLEEVPAELAVFFMYWPDKDGKGDPIRAVVACVREGCDVTVDLDRTFNFESDSLIARAMLIAEATVEEMPGGGSFKSSLCLPIPAPFGTPRTDENDKMRSRAVLCFSHREIGRFQNIKLGRVREILHHLASIVPSFGRFVLGAVTQRLAAAASRLVIDPDLKNAISECLSKINFAFDSDHAYAHICNKGEEPEHLSEYMYKEGGQAEPPEYGRQKGPPSMVIHSRFDIDDDTVIAIAVERRHPNVFRREEKEYLDHAAEIIAWNVQNRLRGPRQDLIRNLADAFAEVSLDSVASMDGATKKITSVLEYVIKAFKNRSAVAAYFQVGYEAQPPAETYIWESAYYAPDGEPAMARSQFMPLSWIPAGITSGGEDGYLQSDSSEHRIVVPVKNGLGYALGYVVLRTSTSLYLGDVHSIKIAANIISMVVSRGRRAVFLGALKKATTSAWHEQDRVQATMKFMFEMKEALSESQLVPTWGDNRKSLTSGIIAEYLPFRKRADTFIYELGVIGVPDNWRTIWQLPINQPICEACGNTGLAALYQTEVSVPDTTSEEGQRTTYISKSRRKDNIPLGSEFVVPVLNATVPGTQVTSYTELTYPTELPTELGPICFGVVHFEHRGPNAIDPPMQDILRLTAFQLQLIEVHFRAKDGINLQLLGAHRLIKETGGRYARFLTEENFAKIFDGDDVGNAIEAYRFLWYVGRLGIDRNATVQDVYECLYHSILPVGIPRPKIPQETGGTIGIKVQALAEVVFELSANANWYRKGGLELDRVDCEVVDGYLVWSIQNQVDANFTQDALDRTRLLLNDAASLSVSGGRNGLRLANNILNKCGGTLSVDRIETSTDAAFRVTCRLRIEKKS